VAAFETTCRVVALGVSCTLDKEAVTSVSSVEPTKASFALRLTDGMRDADPKSVEATTPIPEFESKADVLIPATIPVPEKEVVLSFLFELLALLFFTRELMESSFCEFFEIMKSNSGVVSPSFCRNLFSLELTSSKE
jgi:hypothetical protein